VGWTVRNLEREEKGEEDMGLRGAKSTKNPSKLTRDSSLSVSIAATGPGEKGQSAGKKCGARRKQGGKVQRRGRA